MPWYDDLTPHTYTDTENDTVVNVGWLAAGHEFPKGKTSDEFRAALERLCETPIVQHKGFHDCEFCGGRLHDESTGNGQIRVRGADGIWYAAPTLVAHYVTVHEYLPPPEFIEAVLHPTAIGGHFQWMW